MINPHTVLFCLPRNDARQFVIFARFQCKKKKTSHDITATATRDVHKLQMNKNQQNSCKHAHCADKIINLKRPLLTKHGLAADKIAAELIKSREQRKQDKKTSR